MNKSLVIFTGTLLLLAASIGLIADRLVHPSFLVLISTILAGATWLVYFFIQKAKKEDLVKNYLLTIVMKLIAGGIFIFILLYIDKSGADGNAGFFMATYFLLTGLEVGFLFKQLG